MILEVDLGQVELKGVIIPLKIQVYWLAVLVECYLKLIHWL